jgi:hypothetical protein
MASELELGDWIIQIVAYKDKSILVDPPSQLLLIDHYVRDPERRKERWVFHLEAPRRGVRWSDPALLFFPCLVADKLPSVVGAVDLEVRESKIDIALPDAIIEPDSRIALLVSVVRNGYHFHAIQIVHRVRFAENI